MARIPIIKQMRPRIRIVEHKEAAPTIPSRHIPRIPNRAREGTACDADEEVAPQHDAHVDGALEVEGQLVDHGQRLGRVLRQRPLVRHLPAALRARRHELLDLLLVAAREVHERLILPWLAVDGPCFVEGVEVEGELDLERAPDRVGFDAEVHAVVGPVGDEVEQLGDDLARRFAEADEVAKIVPELHVLAGGIIGDSVDQEVGGDGDDRDAALFGFVFILIKRLQVLQLLEFVVEVCLEGPPSPEVALELLVTWRLSDVDVPAVLHGEPYAVQLLRRDDLHLGADELQLLDQEVGVEPLVVGQVGGAIHEIELRQVGRVAEGHGGQDDAQAGVDGHLQAHLHLRYNRGKAGGHTAALQVNVVLPPCRVLALLAEGGKVVEAGVFGEDLIEIIEDLGGEGRVVIVLDFACACALLGTLDWGYGSILRMIGGVSQRC